MKVPVSWLREFLTTSVDDTVLADSLTMSGLEVEEIESTPTGKIFHTKVTPNRGDWMSLLGTAREASAVLGATLSWSPAPPSRPQSPDSHPIRIDIADGTLCPRYCAQLLGDVKIVDSPSWMADRLMACGMRPLNIVVDVTNYVMLELGQPLHAFDYDKIPNGHVVVRQTRDGESIQTLDGSQRVLPPAVLAICDEERPIAVAGVMGGADTEVAPTTRTVLLESAHFDPGTIRRAAKALGMSTEASYRFERHVDPALVPLAIARAVELLQQFASANVLSSPIDIYPRAAEPLIILLRPSRVNDILGTSLSREEIVASLERLGLTVEPGCIPYAVTVPTFRPDLKLEVDLVEEVGRIAGYANLPETIPDRPGTPAVDAPEAILAGRIRNILCGLGMQEISTFTLSAESPFDGPESSTSRVTIRQALSAELSGLRQSLIPNILDVLARNVRHRQTQIALFETGKVFSKVEDGYRERRMVAGALTGDQGEGESADFFSAKGIVVELLAALRHESPVFQNEPYYQMHTGRSASIAVDGTVVGFVAEVDSKAVRDHLDVPSSIGRVAVFSLNADLLQSLAPPLVPYHALPRFPAVMRDVAAIVDIAIPYKSIELAAKGAVKSDLLADITLQSIYSGDRIPVGKKSVAMRLIFQAQERTLTDAEVETEINSVWTALTTQVKAERR